MRSAETAITVPEFKTFFPILAFLAWFASGARILITYLFFQSDPRLGTAVTNAIAVAIIGLTLMSALALPSNPPSFRWPTTAKWVFAYILWSGASLLWTEANSWFAAFGYWAGYVAEVLLVAILLRLDDPEKIGIASLKGFVYANLVVALVAVLAPGTADYRMGDQEFLHPNAIGFQFAVAALFSIFLCLHSATRSQRRWGVAAAALSLSLARSLSKASIISFLCAAGLYLFCRSRLRVQAKLKIAAITIVLAAASVGFVQHYLDDYLSASYNYETISGRTFIWEESFAIASEKPWLGHGFYSYRSIVPLFGDFEAWHAHNEWLQQWFSFGLVGLALAVITYFSLYKELRRVRSLEADLGWMMLVYSLLHGLTDASHVELQFPLRIILLIVVWMNWTVAKTRSDKRAPIAEAFHCFAAAAGKS